MDFEKQRRMMDYFRKADRSVKRCIEKKLNIPAFTEVSIVFL